MPYLSHYNCYLQEHREVWRRGFFDIEASHLQANFGMVICYCIMDDETEEIKSAVISKKDITNPKVFDKRVIESLLEHLKEYDEIVTFYGTKFDIPFVRTRALIHGLEFPPYAAKKHKDIYYAVKHKFRLHSNRLEVACRTILGETGKTHLRPDVWMAAQHGGDRDAIDYILDHCQEDVKDLRRLYHKVIDFQAPGLRSM